MRTNLWIVIVVVSTIVGFLLGYSVSSYTGVKSAQAIHAPDAQKAEPSKAASAAYPSQAKPEEAKPAAGYGAPAAPAPGAAKPPAAGYGAPVVPANAGSGAKPPAKAPGY